MLPSASCKNSDNTLQSTRYVTVTVRHRMDLLAVYTQETPSSCEFETDKPLDIDIAIFIGQFCPRGNGAM